MQMDRTHKQIDAWLTLAAAASVLRDKLHMLDVCAPIARARCCSVWMVLEQQPREMASVHLEEQTNRSSLRASHSVDANGKPTLPSVPEREVRGTSVPGVLVTVSIQLICMTITS